MFLFNRLSVLSVLLAAISSVAAAEDPALDADLEAAPNANRVVAFVKNTRWERVDFGSPGPTVGDLVTGSGDLSRTRGGLVIGSEEWSAVVTRVDLPGGRELRNSTAQYMWGKNTILIQKISSFPAGARPDRSITYVVVGGTGKYAGARGTARFIVLNDLERKVVFDLL